jgi:ubiquinone/menaquinone biosynthesis C-methylase UbiE
MVQPTQSLKSSTASTYHASDGAAYEKFLGRWTKELAPRFLDFATFSNDGPILDVGTGTGSLAFTMADRWPARNVRGIDVAKPYIAHARAYFNGKYPQFEIGDAAALPYDDPQPSNSRSARTSRC